MKLWFIHTAFIFHIFIYSVAPAKKKRAVQNKVLHSFQNTWFCWHVPLGPSLAFSAGQWSTSAMP